MRSNGKQQKRTFSNTEPFRVHIENETSLPDGGPLSVSIKGKRGLDIGRDPYLEPLLKRRGLDKTAPAEAPPPAPQ